MTAAAALLADCARREIDLWSDEGRLFYHAPAAELTPELLGQLRELRAEIVAALSARGPGSVRAAVHPPTASAPDSGRCRQHVNPADWQDKLDGRRVRTTCRRCGAFIGYRPVDR